MILLTYTTSMLSIASMMFLYLYQKWRLNKCEWAQTGRHSFIWVMQKCIFEDFFFYSYLHVHKNINANLSLSHTQTHHTDIHIHTFTHHTCNLQAMYTVEQKVCKRNILTYLHCSCTSYFFCTVQITTMLIHSKVKDPQDAAHSSFKYTFIFQRPLFLQFQRRM